MTLNQQSRYCRLSALVQKYSPAAPALTPALAPASISKEDRLLAKFTIKYGPAAAYALARLKAGKDYHWRKAFQNIMARCTNPRARRYNRYGGRGIKCLISPEFLLAAFIRDKAWNLKHPSVDRIDNDGHYAPENIRWIEMRDNRRRKSLESTDKKRKLRRWLKTQNLSMEAFAEKAGLKYSTVNGWLYTRCRPRDHYRKMVAEAFPDCPLSC